MPDYLFTPGPTPLPTEVRLALSRPMIYHRTQEFRDLLGAVHVGLQSVFQTHAPVFVMASSGTGAMEAAVVNLLGANHKTLTIVSGKFGERFAELVGAYGGLQDILNVPWGQALDPREVQKRLDADPQIDTVLATLCETSTGVVHPIEALARITRGRKVLLVADAISGLAADPLRMDAWGVDVVVSGSQKGMMLPPGLSFLAAGSRAWERINESRTGRYYFDLRAARKAYDKSDTPFTPAIGLIFALREALDLLSRETMERVWARHALMARCCRAAMEALGLKLYAQAPSNAVTAVCVPPGVDGKKITQSARERFGVFIAGGQGELQGKIFRISHLGHCSPQDLLVGIGCVEMVLKELGAPIVLGQGLQKAQEVLSTP